MTGSIITSLQNDLVKTVSRLHERKYRDEEGLFIVEGRRFTDEIPDDWEVSRFIISESFSAADPVRAYEQRAEVVKVSDPVYKKISDTVTPQGIMAVCRKKHYSLKDLLDIETPLIIIAEALNDPGNLGTLLRTADAAGAAGFILSKGSTDIYGSKVLRAAAGAVFHIPFLESVDLRTVADDLKKAGVTILAAHLKGKAYPYDFDMTKGCGILIGNEANGLTEDAAGFADLLVKIPMPGRAESLNASVAGSIVIYEAVRQRISKVV